MCSFRAYWATMFLLPFGGTKLIEQRIRKFLWAWEIEEQPQLHGNIFATHCSRGVGFRLLANVNKALYCRHLWDITSNDRRSIRVQPITQFRLKHEPLWMFLLHAAPGIGGKCCSSMN
ncbi:UNVERIFIED_CONTAM: hypothetical protein Sradi_5763300 [Sesamum radiatum]|uniref:Secreted protein n=1 Tax=Sesamum radiatum TaxID=300843 RepID=A0AAW2L333_SESRA